MRKTNFLLAGILTFCSCSIFENRVRLPFAISSKLTSQQAENIRWKIRKALDDSELDSFLEGKITQNEMMQTPNKDPYFGEREISPNCLKPNRPKSEVISKDNSKILMMHSTATADFIGGVCSNVSDHYKVQHLILNCKDKMFEIKIYYPIIQEWKRVPEASCK